MPPTHPLLRKGIYVLNIIVQTFYKQENMKKMDPKATFKTLMPLARA
jgi:hypothetical protein